jgi:hypothetical protein
MVETEPTDMRAWIEARSVPEGRPIPSGSGAMGPSAHTPSPRAVPNVEEGSPEPEEPAEP